MKAKFREILETRKENETFEVAKWYRDENGNPVILYQGKYGR